MTRPSWLAVSIWSGLRSRLGTAASLAGIQNIAQNSISSVATSSHHSVPTSGIETKSAHRRKSQMTMTRRRSNLSASAPATGPSSNGGSSFVATTPPSAKLCAWYPLVSWVARAERARRLIQSHTPATEVTSQSRRNAGMARTARTRCAVGADGGGTGVLMAAHLLGSLECRSPG